MPKASPEDSINAGFPPPTDPVRLPPARPPTEGLLVPIPYHPADPEPTLAPTRWGFPPRPDRPAARLPSAVVMDPGLPQGRGWRSQVLGVEAFGLQIEFFTLINYL